MACLSTVWYLSSKDTKKVLPTNFHNTKVKWATLVFYTAMCTTLGKHLHAAIFHKKNLLIIIIHYILGQFQVLRSGIKRCAITFFR